MPPLNNAQMGMTYGAQSYQAPNAMMPQAPTSVPNNNMINYQDMRNVMYADQMNRQLPTIPMIPGKIINSDDDIRPNDVPNDGSVGIFVVKDLSKIVAKAWNNNGTIDTLEFVPVPLKQVQPPTQSMDDFMAAINQRFDKIESMVKRNNRPYKPKREVNTNEST